MVEFFPMNETIDKVLNAKEGKKVLYHVGELSRDVGFRTFPQKDDSHRKREAILLRNWLQDMYKLGQITFIQQRVATNSFNYYAVKLKKPYKAQIYYGLLEKLDLTPHNNTISRRVGTIQEWVYKKPQPAVG